MLECARKYLSNAAPSPNQMKWELRLDDCKKELAKFAEMKTYSGYNSISNDSIADFSIEYVKNTNNNTHTIIEVTSTIFPAIAP